MKSLGSDIITTRENIRQELGKLEQQGKDCDKLQETLFAKEGQLAMAKQQTKHLSSKLRGEENNKEELEMKAKQLQDEI